MIFFFTQMKETMNQEKLAKLQAQVRIGGKVSGCERNSKWKWASLHSHKNLSPENTVFIPLVSASCQRTRCFLCFSIFTFGRG